MKTCDICGATAEQDASTCPICGASLPSSNPSAHSAEPSRKADYSNNYNTQKPKQKQYVNDDVSVGLCIVCFLFPIVGLIYWIVKHKEKPKKSKACLITGIVSWVISFVTNLLLNGSMIFSMIEMIAESLL